QDTGGTLQFNLDFALKEKGGLVADNFTLVADIYVRRAGVLTATNEQIQVAENTLNPGHYMTPAIMEMELMHGDEVLVNVVDIQDGAGVTKWSMPDTPGRPSLPDPCAGIPNTNLRRYAVCYTGP